MVTFPMTLNEP